MYVLCAHSAAILGVLRGTGRMKGDVSENLACVRSWARTPPVPMQIAFVTVSYLIAPCSHCVPLREGSLVHWAQGEPPRQMVEFD